MNECGNGSWKMVELKMEVGMEMIMKIGKSRN